MKNSMLVLDIGAHKGDDTDVYLQSGYSVIAVEANKALTDEMAIKFSPAIKSGKLRILNFAIADKDEQLLQLNINSDSSKSSIFSQQNESIINVTGKRLATLITETGLPHYCKIDIEDADLLAISSLDKNTLPFYISVEISGKPLSVLSGNRDFLFLTLDQLYLLGYKEFKLLDQYHLTVLPGSSFYKKNSLLFFRIINKLKNLLGLDKKSAFLRRFNLRPDAEVSGSFGENLDGRWLNYEETRKLIHFHFEEYVSVTRDKSLIFWVDIHARK